MTAVSARVWEPDLAGMAIRYALLSAHYRQPTEAGPERIKQCTKALRRLYLAAEPCDDAPPVELIETLADDMNTPKAIALMHGYRSRREGRKLFASLRFLGFLGNPTTVDDWRTIPRDHIPAHEIFGGMPVTMDSGVGGA